MTLFWVRGYGGLEMGQIRYKVWVSLENERMISCPGGRWAAGDVGAAPTATVGHQSSMVWQTELQPEGR